MHPCVCPGAHLCRHLILRVQTSARSAAGEWLVSSDAGVSIHACVSHVCAAPEVFVHRLRCVCAQGSLRETSRNEDL